MQIKYSLGCKENGEKLFSNYLQKQEELDHSIVIPMFEGYNPDLKERWAIKS